MGKQIIFAHPEVLAAMYRDGATLQEIGEEFGVTRERIRQLLAKVGVAAVDGGAAVRAMKVFAAQADLMMKKRASRRERLEAEFGCDHETILRLGGGVTPYVAHRNRNGSPAARFVEQRNNSKKRGIEWRMTLWQWWMVWDESGKWPLRGRTRNAYVMARLGDTGPYSVENVYITTLADNGRDYYAVAENKAEWRKCLDAATRPLRRVA